MNETTAGPVAGDVLRRLPVDITNGTYPPGAWLGSERDLADSMGVSSPTLRQALGGAQSGGDGASTSRCSRACRTVRCP